jgi:hypothetical protein
MDSKSISGGTVTISESELQYSHPIEHDQKMGLAENKWRTQRFDPSRFCAVLQVSRFFPATSPLDSPTASYVRFEILELLGPVCADRAGGSRPRLLLGAWSSWLTCCLCRDFIDNLY